MKTDPTTSTPAREGSTPHAAASGAAKPRRSRALRRYALAAAVCAALAGGGGYGWRLWNPPASAAEGLLTAVVERGHLEDVVTATGTLQPRDYVDVGTQVSGQVRKLHVEVGSTVKAGALLAEIDPTVYQTRVDANRAQLRSLRAQLTDRQAQLALAEQQHARQRNLLEAEATTAEALQTAEAALRSAMAQIDVLQAQIGQTESTLRGDEANLGYTRIHAPMAGTVVSLTAKQGQTLNANQQAPIVLRIADLSTMTVNAQVSEADVSRLRAGMEVYFTTLGSGERRWRGTLRQINPTPQVVNNVVLYDVLFDVPNANQALMTQMTAQVFFVVAEARDALLVPVAALRPTGGRGQSRAGAAKAADAGAPATDARPAAAARPDAPARAREATGTGRERSAGGGRGRIAGGSAIVRVVDAAGSVSERTVQVGATNRVSAQVLSGLEPGETVVVGARSEPARTPAAAPANPNRMTPRI